jgi:hypothetical protein
MSDITTVIDKGLEAIEDESGQLSPALYYKNVFIPSLARDLVLFGKTNGAEIVKQYGLDAAELATIVETPVFKTEVKNLRIMMDEGIFVNAQLRAAAVMEGAIDIMAQRLIDPGTKTKDIVAITKELKEIAMLNRHALTARVNPERREAASAAGMTIAFSFGDPNMLPKIPSGERVIDVVPDVLDNAEVVNG